MAGALSRRQQARNEKTLHDLVQSVPGNNVCADCQARNPSWASWNIGIFLCMRCASLHRKLGTHVSKVKSLSMDSWSNEQVENMRKAGNIASNKIYNPQAQRPPVPVDVDEADSAMERFIRQKYISRAFSSSAPAPVRHDTGSSESDDIPPPIPPKTPSRFGLRSATSIFPLSRSKQRDGGASLSTKHSNGSGHFDGSQPPTSPLPRGMTYPRPESSSSSVLRSKASQIFGASVPTDTTKGDNLDSKLAKLRDMGFFDDRQNTVILRAVKMDLERAVEMLVRMGDAGVGNGRLSPNPLTAARESSLAAPTRTLTPTTTTAAPSTLSVPTPSRQTTSSPSAASSKEDDPFAMLDFAPPPPPPQSSQSTGTLQNKNPYNAMNTIVTTNPFGLVQSPHQMTSPFGQAVTASSSALNLNQAFQNMALSPQQPLFPNHTGTGTFSHQQLLLQQQQQQQQQQLQQQYLLLQQKQQQQQAFHTLPSSTASMAGQSYFAAMPTATNQASNYFSQPFQQSNPFLSPGGTQQQQPQQQQPQQPLSVNTVTGSGIFSNNPFTRSPTTIQSPGLGQIPEQTQASYVSTLSQSHTFPLPNGTVYGAAIQSLQAPAQQPHFFHQSPQQPVQPTNNPFATQPVPAPQPPHLHDTASIMALYNMQQFAPTQSSAPPQVDPTAASLQQSGANKFGFDTSGTTSVAPEAQNVASPVATNPFFSMAGGAIVGNANVSPGSPFSSLGHRHPPPPPPAPSSGAAKASTADIFAGGRSRDSMMALGLEWTNGRHSPDAFASLSARH